MSAAKGFVLIPRLWVVERTLELVKGRIAWAMQKARKGLRNIHQLSRSMDAHRKRPHADTAVEKALKSSQNF